MFFTHVVGNIFAQPANDACSGQGGVPVQLTVNGSCSTLNVTGATQSINWNSCYGSTATQNDVWYKFTATSSSQTITVTPNSAYDAVVQLLTACATYNSPAPGTWCVDAHGNGQAETLNATGLSVGTAYYIRVYSYSGTSGGNITVCVTGSGGGCSLTGVTPTLSSPGTTSSPGPTISNSTPTLSWNALSGAAMYGVYVRDMGTNTLVVNNNCATSGTSYTLPSGTLSSSGQYRWAVIAYDACNSTCQSNQATQFYFQTPGNPCSLTGVTPTLSSPGTGSSPGTTITTTTPTLSWNSVSGATNYDLYVSIAPYGSGNIVYQQLCVSGTSLTVPSGNLNAGNQYRWNIQANVSCGSCVSSYSSPFYFNIQTTCIPVSVAVQPQNQTACSGNSAIFSVSAGGDAPFLYFWYKNGVQITGASNATYTTPTLTSGDNGNTYYCIITNCNSLQQAISNTVNLTVNSSPSIPTVTQSGSTTFCQGGSVTLTSSNCSGCTYSWSPNGEITQSVNASNAGNYTVTVNNGCGTATSSPVVTVTVNPSVIPSVSISANPFGSVCAGTNITFTANPVNGGTPSYQWKLNGNTVGSNASYSNSSLVNGDQVSCAITSNANCASPTTATSNTVTIAVNSITVSATIVNAACGQSNGSATATASGNTPPYTYHWSNGQNTQTATGLAANTYTVTATGSTGCIASTTASVSNTGGPSLTTASTQDNGTCNGTTTVNANGGVPPYTYLWSSNANNQTTATATALCGNASYNVTVKDANNCITTATVFVPGTTTGINGQTGLSGFVIYPNPSMGLFTLSYELSNAENLQIQVLSITGEVIYSKEYKKVSGKFSKEINLNNVAVGIYSVEIKAGEKRYSQKLIKE